MMKTTSCNQKKTEKRKEKSFKKVYGLWDIITERRSPSEKNSPSTFFKLKSMEAIWLIGKLLPNRYWTMREMLKIIGVPEKTRLERSIFVFIKDLARVNFIDRKRREKKAGRPKHIGEKTPYYPSRYIHHLHPNIINKFFFCENFDSFNETYKSFINSNRQNCRYDWEKGKLPRHNLYSIVRKIVDGEFSLSFSEEERNSVQPILHNILLKHGFSLKPDEWSIDTLVSEEIVYWLHYYDEKHYDKKYEEYYSKKHHKYYMRKLGFVA